LKNLINNRTTAVVGAAGLLVTLGGVSGAVAANTIGSKDIKNDSIRSVDVHNNTLRSKDVKDGVLGMRDLNDYTKAQIAAGGDGADGATGPRGPKGDTGATGPQGPKGDTGPAATVGLSHWSVGGTVPAMQNGLPGSIEVIAECQQEGHLAIAGGYTAGSYKGGVTTYQNRNTAGAPGTDAYGAGWLVGFTNTTDQAQTVRTWVVCASVVEDEPAG
jgi:hypothetical protein